MIKQISILFLALISTTAYAQKNKKNILPYLHIDQAVNAISTVMIHDVVNPPAASRYYAYITLGAYNLVSLNNKQIIPVGNFIKSYTQDNQISIPADKYDYRIAAMYCILETGKQMLPSGFMLQHGTLIAANRYPVTANSIPLSIMIPVIL